jgi:Flp pilus assembly protein TadB
MTTNQTVWLISFIILMVCILLALLLYLYTGHIFIAILIAPPIIHWILKKRQKDPDQRF